MRYQRLLLPTILCLFLSAGGQEQAIPKDHPAYYFNSFQKHSESNEDSALFYIRKLASKADYTRMLTDLLHDAFAQSFMKREEKDNEDPEVKKQRDMAFKTAQTILTAMISDDNPRLVKAAQPIYFWTQIQQNANDDKKVNELVLQFVKTQLSANDLFTNRIGRYSLIIHQLIAEKKSLEPRANDLLQSVVARLEKEQVMVDTDTASRTLLEKRAWYRYLYAYANFKQGNQLLKQKKNKEAGNHLKIAFNNSPDMVDKRHNGAYFYDMMFLIGKEKDTFQDDYIDYLKNFAGDKKETLSALLTTALVNPDFKKSLKSFYQEQFSNSEEFEAFWINAFNQQAKPAPGISLKKMDGSSFSFSDNQDKWILLDFWGTWCIPCRKEHPDLEKLYQDIRKSFADKIVLLTVACNDQEDKVSSYMTQYKYTFPVAMADQKIEKAYNINSYPSKILISPQGKFVVVPFNVDWISYVKAYANL